MSSYTNYQLPPNYGYQQPQQPQQYQQYQQQQQQYATQYPSQYPPQYAPQTQSNDYQYGKPAPAPVSAPLPSYAYQQASSPAPSMYSASTMSSYSTPSNGSSDDLIGMYNYNSPPPKTQPTAARPVTPEMQPRQVNRPSSNDDLQAIVASQERAMVQSKQGRQARSLSPMVQRRDYVVPKDSRGKKVISDGIHPEKYEMKKSRKLRTAGGATSGAIVGGLLAGPAFPVGMAIGAAVGGYGSNKMHKMQERRRQRRHEQRNFQKAAKNTVVAKSESIALC